MGCLFQAAVGWQSRFLSSVRHCCPHVAPSPGSRAWGGKGSQPVGQGAVLTQRMAQPCQEASSKLYTFEYVATFCRDPD